MTRSVEIPEDVLDRVTFAYVAARVEDWERIPAEVQRSIASDTRAAMRVALAAIPYLAPAVPEDTRMDEERGFVETALAAVDAGNAGHWPTVAGYLADEVRRLRAMPAEVVVDHRPGETCSVAAEVDPETGFARAPAGDGGLREALHGWIREEIERAIKFHAATKGNGHQAGDTCDGWTALAEAEQMLHDDAHELLDAAPAVPQPADERPLRAALEKYFSNGGPDTPIRTTWHDGVEHWEAPAEDIRELIGGSAVPQLVDREALRKAVQQHLPFNLEGSARANGIVDAVLAVLAGESSQEQVEK